jgi:hypothetical protein
MSKLLDRLNKQSETEYKQDAEDCLRLYQYLKDTTGGVWESQWCLLVDTIFEGFPSDKRRFKPTNIGRTVLIGLKAHASG